MERSFFSFHRIGTQSFLQEFYFGAENSSNGGILLFKLKNSTRTIPFIPILKCANKGITENLIQMSNIIDWKSDFITSRDEFERRFSTIQRSDHNSTGDTVRSFTFVRDPLQHFISGFVHSVFVSLRPPQLISPLNESQIEHYLRNLILQRSMHLEMEEYMFPMSRTYLRFPVDIVGRLESFSEDWERKIVPAYGITALYDYHLGMHPTSTNHPLHSYNTGTAKELSREDEGGAAVDRDPMRARESLVALLHSHSHYLRALCHILLLDYVCLTEYQLPHECAFLQPLRAEIQQQEKLRSYKKGGAVARFYM